MVIFRYKNNYILAIISIVENILLRDILYDF